MFNRFLQNTCKPKGTGGKIMVNMMNKGHAMLSKWGFSHINVSKDRAVLDIGCGGGANIAKWLELCPQGKVYGVDYSPISVKKSIKTNINAVKNGRCFIKEGNVLSLPFEDGIFDCANAFETVYFWKNLQTAFSEVYRVLKENGTFMICNETDGQNKDAENWEKQIDGFKAYTASQLEEYLSLAGFKIIKTDILPEKSWIFITAQK